MTCLSNAIISKLSDSGQTITPSAEDIRGRTVKDQDGKDLGKVHDLLIDDQEHKVRFMLVEHGGLLGIGETKSFIPIDAITEITASEVFINHAREHVAKAPHTTRTSSMTAAITSASTATTDATHTGEPTTSTPAPCPA
jgi:uncharacterized protein YrrD